MKIPTNIKLEKEIRERLQEIANEEHRSLSNLISKILYEYLEKKEKL